MKWNVTHNFQIQDQENLRSYSVQWRAWWSENMGASITLPHLSQIQGCRFSSVVVIPVHVENLQHVHTEERKIKTWRLQSYALCLCQRQCSLHCYRLINSRSPHSQDFPSWNNDILHPKISSDTCALWTMMMWSATFPVWHQQNQ
jgi:hypothetical protein